MRAEPAIGWIDEPVVIDVNRDRLLDDLRAVATIGAQPDGGVDRLAWSDADLAGRRWYAERIREAGLEPPGGAGPDGLRHPPRRAGPRPRTRPPPRKGPHRGGGHGA